MDFAHSLIRKDLNGRDKSGRSTKLAVRRALIEALDKRILFISAGQLLAYDFNSGTAWASATASTTAGSGVSASVAQSTVGTIDTEGSTSKTGGMDLLINSVPSTGLWASELNSGKLSLSNTETNLGKLTLSFNLSASQGQAVNVHLYSYDSSGSKTGALEGVVNPAAGDAYPNGIGQPGVSSFQRFSVDLSTMKAIGSGTFNPAAPFVSFGFELSSLNGWSTSTNAELRVDNVAFAKPAYYVKPYTSGGRDTADGRTEATAFATPQHALDVSQPGDTIDLMARSATDTSTVPYDYTATWGIMNFNTGGTPAAWVTVKNYPGQSPLLYNEYWNAIVIGASSASTDPAMAYIEIRGLHVQGDSAKVGSRNAPDGAYDPTAPNADQYGPYAQYIQPIDPVTGKNSGGTADPRTNGNGISVSGGNEAHKPHDIRIADNLVEDNAGGGIGAGSADRIQIENNIVRDNCYWDKYATSGISILSTYSFDGASGTITRLVRGNISSGNIHKEKWVRNDPVLTQYSDGNGIIIDFNHDASGTVENRTLVTNNLVFDNGGSGIHAYNADHVDIINNTAYLNSASPYLQYGEIFSQGKDTRIYNNILVAPTAAAGLAAEQVNGGNKPSSTNGIVYANNVYFGGNTPGWAADAYNINNLTADPKFANATVNAALADFRLQSTSPAINAGLSNLVASNYDILGNVRKGTPDVGAYEYYAAAPTIVTSAIATPSPVTGTTVTLGALAGDNDGPGNLTYTWSTVAHPTGSSGPTFGLNGTTTSKLITATFARAGGYTLRVTVSDGTNTSTSNVSVTVNQTLTSITVAPTTAALNLNGTTQFAATAFDQFGVAMTTQPTFTWAKGSGIGSIDATGLYTAPATAGSASITAKSGSISSAAALITITNAVPTVAIAASASPNPVTGKTATLSVLGADDGTEPNLIYTWATTGTPPAAVGFSVNGTNASKSIVAMFSQPGSYSFLVTITDSSNASITSSVNVTVNATLNTIVVTPGNATIDLGTTKQFSATAYDQFGTALAVQPALTWAVASGIGSISSSGLYTAPGTAGGALITVSSGGVTSAAATVSVADLTAPTLSTVVSSKVHGTAGTFNLNLALGGVTKSIEPRINGANKLIFTFSESIKASDGTLSSNEFVITNAIFGSATISGNTLTLNLTNIVNRKYMNVSLAGIADLGGNGLAGTSMLIVGNLLGDVNRSGNVSATDQQFVKSNTGKIVTASNFLYDVNASGGVISVTDQQFVKSNLGSVLSL